MLFNSFEFIFVFLPVVLVGFFLLANIRHSMAIAWLVAASLFFYAWWNPPYVGILVCTVLFNYACGIYIARTKDARVKKLALVLGLAFNLILLGYFKYTNWFIDNLRVLTGFDLYVAPILLPLAISFHTFQQIAYLVDVYRGEARKYVFLHYCLFVTFFPQLIAGPIVLHHEMLPQFSRNAIFRFHSSDFAVGMTMFFMGLFKKVILADSIAKYPSAVFGAADAGLTLTFFEAWGGALAYTFQLYFNFSGYSDMAIGLARMFGIRLPVNFNSPYQAANMIDFWRRWHMTLSRFLRNYLYIPLGGNRQGSARKYLNVLITMLLAGLWHGAAWTFVVWGGLHGVFLVINNAWRSFQRRTGQDLSTSTPLGRTLAWSLTFIAVVVAWVFFRAKSFDAAISILLSMSGLNGVSPTPNNNLANWSNGLTWLSIFAVIAWFAPNTQQLMGRYRPVYQTAFSEWRPIRILWWRPTVAWALVIALIAVFSITGLTKKSEFLYFQF